MNILDSELVKSQLEGLGYEFVEDAQEAGVVLFNTCSVRDLSEHKVRSRLGVMKKRKEAGEQLLVGVLGCMAERAHADLVSQKDVIDFMVGPSRIAEVPALLASAKEKHADPQVAISHFHLRKGKEWAETENPDTTVSLEALDQARLASFRPTSNASAYVRITRGCNKFCSFCVVPKTRGPEVHRHPNQVVDEIKRLVDRGVLEVTLLGQTINHYSHVSESEQTTSFAKLLYRIHEEVKGLQRLRFLTSYPRDFTQEALDVMASCARICNYLHIPAQSGSNRILQRMNRGYTREMYMELVQRARSKIPRLSIVGDMIVGFPSETEEDFLLSLSLLEEVQYKNVFVFKYSPRPGTVSGKRDPDDVSTEIKQERNRRMLELQRTISIKQHQALIGQTLPVLVEAEAKVDPASKTVLSIGRKTAHADWVRLTARTTGDHIVAFDGPKTLIGHIVPVSVLSATPLSVCGNWNPFN